MDINLPIGVFSNDGSGFEPDYWNILGHGVEGRYVPGSGNRYYYKDHLGSTRAVVNATGTILDATDYYPFGLAMPGRSHTTAPGTKEGFTGHERDDEVGLDYMVARRYDPALGRFLSVDPMADQYPGWSPYVYVGNNPLRFIDPTGMHWVCVNDDDGELEECYYNSDINADNASEYLAENEVYMGTGLSVMFDDIEIYLMEDGDWDYVYGVVPEMPEIDGIGSVGTGYAWAMSLNSEGRSEALAAGRNVVLARDYQAWQEARGSAVATLVLGSAWMSPARALWIRAGRSGSQVGDFSTRISIRWGSNERHRRKIKNEWLRNKNAQLNSKRLPGNSWRVQDPGHLHIIR